MLEDLLINFGADVAFVAFPFVLLGLFAAPFVVTYTRKKKITLISGLMSTLIGAALVVLALIGTYWGLGYLQGYAARDIYGF